MPNPTTRFLSERDPAVHGRRPWSQFRAVNRRLPRLVERLLAEADLRPGDVVLDYGCATAPYRSLLASGVRYLGADLPGNLSADLELAGDGSVPLGPGSVSAVLSTQVLEHVADPMHYLSEARRVLKPGGSLVLTTHGIMYYHRDPEDYWRWTASGLTAILQSSGFVVAGMDGVLGLPGAALQLFQDAYAWRMPRRLRKGWFLLMQAAIEACERREPPDQRLNNCLVIGVRAAPA